LVLGKTAFVSSSVTTPCRICSHQIGFVSTNL